MSRHTPTIVVQWPAGNGLETKAMFDLLMLVLLAAAFAGAVGYVRACDDLTRPTGATPAQVS
jgi:hypothetical protein